jgi:hypothetical protein
MIDRDERIKRIHKSMCQYLIDNENKVGFDEVAYCPRLLNESEKRILLDALSGRIMEMGQNLEEFLMHHDDVDMSYYYDCYYRKLSVLIRDADAALALHYDEPMLK